MDKKIRIIVADDHPLVLCALNQALVGYEHIALVASAKDSTALVKQLATIPYDIAVTDFFMPGGEHGDGLTMLEYLRKQFPALRLVVLSMLGNSALLRAMQRIGVMGIVSKDDDFVHIGPAILAVNAGYAYYSPTIETVLARARARAPGRRPEPKLTRREAEVLRLYAAGQAISQIAVMVRRSAKTVSAQRKTAMRKLGLANDADLFQYARSSGLTGVRAIPPGTAHATEDPV
jgi:two-component system capsular synthesis response regulator RcsB